MTQGQLAETAAELEAGLSDDELDALRVAQAVYEAVRHVEVLDCPEHWERFANRLASAAYAQTGCAFVEQVARRFGLAHPYHPELARMAEMPGPQARRLLRIVRQQSAPLSVLVRDRRTRG